MCGLFQCSGAVLFSPGCLLRWLEKVTQGMSFPALSPLFIFGWREGSGELESSVVCPESWQCHLTSSIIPEVLFSCHSVDLCLFPENTSFPFMKVSWQCERQEPGRPWPVTSAVGTTWHGKQGR